MFWSAHRATNCSAILSGAVLLAPIIWFFQPNLGLSANAKEEGQKWVGMLKDPEFPEKLKNHEVDIWTEQRRKHEEQDEHFTMHRETADERKTEREYEDARKKAGKSSKDNDN